LTEEEMDILKLDVSNDEIYVVIKNIWELSRPLERMAFKQFSIKSM